MSTKLLTNLNFADLISKTEAITEAGKDMLNTYKGYCFSNPVSCSLVNSFINEASKYNFDTGLNNILESVKKYINENNISWKLASACESILANDSTYNYINRVGVQQVEKLLEMNESEVISYIKAGSLKNIQYIPEFRAICKEVYKTQITESKALNYTVTNPISYVLLNEGNTEQIINVCGTYFKISDKVERIPECNDMTFNRINMLLESFTRDGDSIFYEIRGTHGDVARFTFNEDKLTLTKGNNINETFDNPSKFMEYCNMLSKTMPIHEKMQFMSKVSAISEVFENISNVCLLDNVKVLNASNGTVCAIIEAKDNVNLTVFRSFNAGTSSTNFDYVVEALNNVIKLTGIDIRPMFEERINEDCKKQNPEEEKIREELEANKEAQYAIRKKKIAMLAEQHKNDPTTLMLLNKIAKDLRMLEEDKN